MGTSANSLSMTNYYQAIRISLDLEVISTSDNNYVIVYYSDIATIAHFSQCRLCRTIPLKEIYLSNGYDLR